MKKVVKVILNCFLLLLCCSCLIMSSVSLYQRANGVRQPMLFGYGLAVVETGSMEPNIPTGSLIVIHKQEDYNVGDVITYIDYRDWSITHRVVEENGDKFVTKGDANLLSDPEFSKEAVIGKVVWFAPILGKIAQAIQSPIVLICLIIVYIVLSIISGVKKKSKADLVNEIETSSELGLDSEEKNNA